MTVLFVVLFQQSVALTAPLSANKGDLCTRQYVSLSQQSQHQHR